MAEVRLFFILGIRNDAHNRPQKGRIADCDGCLASGSVLCIHREAEEHAVYPPLLELNTPHNADVVFALTGDLQKNSRAQRQVRALSDIGLRTHVLYIGSGAKSNFQATNAETCDLGAPEGRGARYFWKLHRKFMKAAAGVHGAIYHASDLYVLPALAAAAANAGGKLIYDARELYPHVVSTVGRPWVRQFWMQTEKRFIRRADAVFTVSGGIADRLASIYGIDRPVVVHNVPEVLVENQRESTREPVLQRTQAVILHLGQMRPHRGCELLVDAMREVEGGILVFLGDGPLRNELKRRAAHHHIEGRIHFLDPVPPDEVVAYARTADIGVTLLDDVCLNHRLALPNKLFEYLTAGLPVIASDLPEIRKIVRGYEVGQVVRPGSRDDLVAALKQAILDRSLREYWQKNIPQVLETFNWEQASHAFLQTYQDVLQTT